MSNVVIYNTEYSKEQLEALLDAFRHQKDMLKDLRKSLKQKDEQLKQKEEQLEKLRNMINDIEGNLKLTIEEIEKESFKQYKQEYISDACLEKYKKMEEENSELKSKLDELNQLKKDSHDLQIAINTINKLREQNDGIGKVNKELRVEIQVWKDKYDELVEQKDFLRKENDMLKDPIAQRYNHTNEIRRLKYQVDKYKGRMEDRDEMYRHIEDVKNELSKTEYHLSNKMDILLKYQGEIKDILNDKGLSAEEKVEAINFKVQTFTDMEMIHKAHIEYPGMNITELGKYLYPGVQRSRVKVSEIIHSESYKAMYDDEWN